MFSVGSIYTNLKAFPQTSFPLNGEAFEDSYILIKASRTSEEHPNRMESKIIHVLEIENHIKQIYSKVFLNSFTNIYLPTNY